MSEHKSPYTGGQVDEMLNMINFSLYPALSNIGPNLDKDGNVNLSNPTNSIPSQFNGTFTEFKNEFMKLINRSYLKDYFIINEDNTVTIDTSKLFRQKTDEDLMFLDYRGDRIFGISNGYFIIFNQDEPLLTTGSEGLFINKLEGVIQSAATHIAVFDTNKLLGKIPVTWFAKATDLALTKEIAQGATVSYAFHTVAELDSWIAGTGGVPINDSDALPINMKVGTNLFIINDYESDYWWDGTGKQVLSGDSSAYQRANIMSIYGGAARDYSVVFVRPLPSANYIIQFSADGMDAKFRTISKTTLGFTVEITPNAAYSYDIPSVFENLTISRNDFYSGNPYIELPLPIGSDANFMHLFTINPDGTLTAKRDIVGTLSISLSTIESIADDTYQYEQDLNSAVFYVLGKTLVSGTIVNDHNTWTLTIPAQSFSINIPANTVVPMNRFFIQTTRRFGGQTNEVNWGVSGLVNAVLSDTTPIEYIANYSTCKISI